MEEPHQRVQSGKLRQVSRRSNSESAITFVHETVTIYPGVENATRLEVPDSDDSLDSFLQTPSALSDFHIEFLTKMANGFGIQSPDCVDRYWKRTWSIGTWCIGSNVSLSISIMQPNISSSWATLTCPENDEIVKIADQYKAENLPKSTSFYTKIGKGYQLKGRWTLTIVDRLIKSEIIKREDVEITSANIGQTKLFCWLLIDKQSEYFCTLTKESVEHLVGFIPDWCSDLREQTSASNISLRIKNPVKVNDSTQLTITTSGDLKYQGSLQHISRLPEALSTALRSIVNSRKLITFLESMEYKEIPSNLSF